jgi:hypothetical protein
VASSLTDPSKSSHSSRDSRPPTTMTSLSTILEQDFTVAGKKSNLDCPFSQLRADGPQSEDSSHRRRQGSAPHPVDDPLCAAMYDDTSSHPTTSAAAKCPIRYMDQHSPEEIAQYLETHKHELPRSHEVCVRRYQKNEDHIRKLDAKYGTLVSMVEGLSKIHQPMLPEQDTRPQSDVENGSNDRVVTWAQTVGAEVTDDPEHAAMEQQEEEDDDGRQSHFDRDLKEVRVGESPSRPWGIRVPQFENRPISRDGEAQRPESPPPAPVHMPQSLKEPETLAKKTGKCPFDHTKLAQMMEGSTSVKHEDKSSKASINLADIPSPNQPFTPGQAAQPSPQPASSPSAQPAFLNATNLARPNHGSVPQMLFTGPVFIGYPIEQAIQFMQQYQGQQ